MLLIRIVLILLFVMPSMARALPPNDDIGITVERRDAVVLISVDLPLDVSPEEVWETVTDYDNMSRFLPKLTESRVVSRDGNHLRIAQKGRTSRGFLTFAFENVRDVVLVPHSEIRSKLVSGTLRKAQSVTRIVRKGSGSRLVNQGEYQPAAWVPVALAMPFIEAETREQFGLLRAEIMRRRGRGAGVH
ncbi:MAG: SRPBCC family protein [Casimicrobiaceae bacterium]